MLEGTNVITEDPYLYTIWVRWVSERFGKPVHHPERQRVNDNASPEMKKAILFANLEVEPYEVQLFAYFITSLVFVIELIAAIIFLIYNHSIGENHKNYIDLPGVFIGVVMPLVLGPLIMFYFAANYPMTAAKRIKVQSLGKMPEVINYLVMSMRLSPALNKAIAFAADNASMPMAGALKKVLWDVYMRRYDSIEEAFLAFAFEWGEWNEDFKRSLFTIRSAELEKTQQGIDRGLEKATDIILLGTKNRMDIFVGSLSGPTFVLFSLGILLPMVIGAMLPMMSMGGMNLKAPQVVALMNILVPIIVLYYAFHILGSRPGTTSAPHIPSPLSPLQKRSILVTSLMMAGIFFGLAIFTNIEAVRTLISYVGTLPIVWGLGLPIAYYAYFTSKDQKKRRDEIKQMEVEFPDALFQLGSRIAEGAPLEIALEKTADNMKGTLIAEVFKKTAYILQITRGTLDEVLFGKMGVLTGHPSRTIRAVMKTVSETTKKDAVTAGTTIINISNYLRDMMQVDHEIRNQLNSVMDMMKTTGTMFAPIIMGVTASMFVVLRDAFSQINIKDLGGTGGGLVSGFDPSKMMDPYTFALIMGIYLVEVVLIITYYSAGIIHGEDWIERKYALGRSILTAIVIYTVTLVMGTIIFGGD